MICTVGYRGLLYVVVANLPLWVASHVFGLSIAGVFNVEFLLLGALSVLLPGALSACLLLGVVALDLVHSIGKTYMFRPAEMLASLPSLLAFAPSHLAGILAVIVLVAVIGLLAARQHRASSSGERWGALALFGVVALAAFAVDCSRGQVAFFHFDTEVGQTRMLRNSVHQIMMESRQPTRQSAPAGAAAMDAASLKLASLEGRAINGSVHPDVVFVLVESWGSAAAGELNDQLLQPYDNQEIRDRYTLTRGTVPFRGPTVSGEMRELCGSTLGFGALAAPESAFRECLPAKFERAGYRTVSIHGFDASMFTRGSLYPRMRFQQSWFRSNLLAQGLPVCPGPLPGICDAAIADWIGPRLRESSSPEFVYWLTLNSHLPVPTANLVKDPPACDASAVLVDEALCSWFRLIFNVHRSVAHLAMQPLPRPTVFVLVGDHAPPFSSAARQAAFSKTVVPYVMLWPREMAGGGHHTGRTGIASLSHGVAGHGVPGFGVPQAAPALQQ